MGALLQQGGVAPGVLQRGRPQLRAECIARRAMPTLLATQRKFYAPADISLAFHSFPLLKVYTVLPRVADQFDNNLPE
jgi:hypothetical protein